MWAAASPTGRGSEIWVRRGFEAGARGCEAVGDGLWRISRERVVWSSEGKEGKRGERERGETLWRRRRVRASGLSADC